MNVRYEQHVVIVRLGVSCELSLLKESHFFLTFVIRLKNSPLPLL